MKLTDREKVIGIMNFMGGFKGGIQKKERPLPDLTNLQLLALAEVAVLKMAEDNISDLFFEELITHIEE